MSKSLPRGLFTRDGSIWARVWHNGREHRRCLHTTSERAAVKALGEFRAELAARAEAREAITFRAAAVEWDATYLRGLKPKTAGRYRVSLRQLDGTFGDKTLPQITARLIGQYVRDRAAAGVTNATIKNDLTALSTILRVAMSRGWIEQNAAAAWDRRVIKHPQKAQRPPSRATVEAVLGYSKTWAKRALIDFLHQSGCRLSEAIALRWPEVDFVTRTVTLIETKRGQPRVIRMATPGGNVEPILQACKRNERTQAVFWFGDGRQFTQASSGLRDFYTRVAGQERAAGRQFTPFRTHDLRHSFAIAWLNAGGDIYELSRHLGHTSVKTTEQFYLKWMDPAARDRYEARQHSPRLVYDRHQSGTSAVSQVPVAKKADG